MDIVYIFKEVPHNDSIELRYSLRSLKNLSHSRVFIAGDKPKWTSGVLHIPVAQSKTKHENGMMNLRAAIDNPDVSKDFIMMNDDFFVMKPLSVMPALHYGTIESVIKDYLNRYPEGSIYIQKMIDLDKYLKSIGIVQPISYELHTPMVLNKKKVEDMLDSLNGQRMFQFRSFYGNYYKIEGQAIDDVKIYLDSAHNPFEYNDNPEKHLSKQTFLSTTSGSFNYGVPGEYIRKNLSSKSIYEA